MASQRISVRISGALGQKLRKRSLLKQASESDLVREALENYLRDVRDEPSAFEVAEQAGLIGCVRRLPRDLSTNRKHFEGFGKAR